MARANLFMIDLYFWPTANGIKIPILLEELALPYRPFPLNIRLNEHKTEAFRQLNAHQKIPLLVDHEPSGGGGPLPVFESSAILLYLAEKQRAFLPQPVAGRYAALEWLFWHAAHLVPVLGQYQRLHEQGSGAVPTEPARQAGIDVSRLYRLLDTRLAGRDYLADDYSIADIAIFPWIQPRRQGQIVGEYPHLDDWLRRIRSRPAVERAYAYGRRLGPEEKSLADWL
ncbi:glutathione S-transferase family protein [Paludibacterium yongneupense]|uniref:glutathione S-transferase family protein n=1 Tax=Paludibacterium yongneupense TaxID=400061 RepID=UPI000424FAE1|nr:glutathione binding-like protein [Paludibacterium yongneupense]